MFNESYPIMDKYGKDSLWEAPIYSAHQQEEINNGLKVIYANLKASGNLRIVQHKYIDRIEYCTFGNTNPFRIRIVNRLNDVYDYFYVKKADASRIYGLELEEILSPNQVNYLVDRETLIEEHIAGIPGDVFAKNYLHNPDYNPTRIAKEFVKFNERCLVMLLGDMRAYNFVVQVTPDFDDIQFRIRAIDFDQQFYEGNIKIYLPQFFKENFPYVKMCMDLRDVSNSEVLTTAENIQMLKNGMAEYFSDQQFQECKNMTDIVELNIKNIIRQVKL